MSNLTVRLLTVAILGPLLLLLLFYGPVWGFSLLIALSAAQSASELVRMTHPDHPKQRIAVTILTGLFAAAVVFYPRDSRVLMSAVVLLVISTALVPLFSVGKIETAALRTLGGVAAPFYAGLLLSTLALLNESQGSLGPRYVFFTLQLAWMGDTGGYTFGRLFGKTKLYESVSPKKTREGLYGSIVFSTAAGVLASLTYLPVVPITASIALGIFGALLGQSGDLVESLVKRSTGVKDSGSILPGHGGLLDRIDALLLVSPLVYVYTLWA